MQLGTVGSGLDVDAIVKALVDADVAPKTNALDRKESALNAELSALGTLKSKLAALDSSLEELSNGAAFDVLSIDAPSSVKVVQTGSPAEGLYTIDVNTLASSQVLASGGFSSASSVVGTGILTIEIGTPTYATGSSGAYSGFTPETGKTVNILIDSTNNTVSGIRDAINASGADVTASLVVDGTQTRLLLESKTSGAGTSISISADDNDLNDADTSGLSQLAYHLSGSGETATFVGNLSEARPSRDASFTLNGLALTNSSNSISGLIDGLDFTLKKATTTTETIIIERDTAGIENKVQGFVDGYNEYQTTLSSLMDYKDENGALAGDTTARRIQSVIRSETTGTINLSGNAFSALSDLGITSDRYGKLSLKSSDFQAALSSNSSDMKVFFAGNTVVSGLSDNTDSTGLADRIKTSIDRYTNSVSGMLVGRELRLDGSIDDISDDRAKIAARMASLEERYTKQFTAMDTLVGQLQGTSDFLTSQMDALKAAANR